ncbi:unnamed protein product, partial [Linum tenue]
MVHLKSLLLNKDLGHLSYFIGLEITRTDPDIFLVSVNISLDFWLITSLMSALLFEP